MISQTSQNHPEKKVPSKILKKIQIEENEVSRLNEKRLFLKKQLLHQIYIFEQTIERIEKLI